MIDQIIRGGVFYDVQGETPADFLANFIARLPPLASLPADMLLKAVLEREWFMPTAIGRGIAVPHPRTPLLSNPDEQFVSIGFSQKPLAWNALDGEAVNVALLVVSASAKLHLVTLSQINYFFQQDDFRALLKTVPTLDAIIEVIRKAEKTWRVS